MIVVSDTTAITSLLKVGRVELLAELFRDVLIPAAVRDELLRYHADLPAFLQVRIVQQAAEVQQLCAELDRGESEAIVLATEASADALLIDEKRGRQIAEAKGILCLGLPAAILLAKERGIIPSVHQILAELETKGRFCLAASVKQQILELAGEA